MVAQAAVALADQPIAPYRRGALSQFLAWVDSLPGHGWWVYPGLGLALVVWGIAVLLLSGSMAFGTTNETLAIIQTMIIGVVYGPAGLAAVAYINGVAARAISAFWPATGWPDSDRGSWTYRFVTTPAGYGWACLAMGIPLAIGSFLQAAPGSLAPATVSQAVVFVAYIPALVLGYTMLPAGVIHIVRQLRLVDQIHREARAIDPFDRVPVYAFSGLTARAGLVFVIVAYYSFTVNGAFQAGNLVSSAVIGAGLVVGLACFVLPLWGIHDRLGQEKELLLRDVEERMSRLGEEMYRRIDAGQFDGTKVVSEALAGVGALRDRISRLPTWPWPPNLMRGFISALLLPVVVYLISRLIGGRIGA